VISGHIAGKPGDRCVFRLLQTNFSLPPALCATYSLLCEQSSGLAVSLELVLEGGETRYLTLDYPAEAPVTEGQGVAEDSERLPVDINLWRKYGLERCRPITRSSGRLAFAPLAAAPEWACPTQPSAWASPTFVLAEEALRGRRVTELRLSVCVKSAPVGPDAMRGVCIRLGRLALFRPSELADLQRSVVGLKCSDVRWCGAASRDLAVSLTLSWEPFVTATGAVSRQS